MKTPESTTQSERIAYFPSFARYRQLARGEVSVSDYATAGPEKPRITVRTVTIQTSISTPGSTNSRAARISDPDE